MTTPAERAEYLSKRIELCYRCNDMGHVVQTQEYGGILSLARLLGQLDVVGFDGSRPVRNVAHKLVELFAEYKLGPRPVEKPQDPMWIDTGTST